MQLSKLYCNDKKFKSIEFKLNSLNVIYADVNSKPEAKDNSHSLGKTRLGGLIDFLLLKEINFKTHFLFKIKEDEKSIFNDYIFYLEIYLNSGKYLTIKRTVEANTKISFSLNEATIEKFSPPKNWQNENVPIRKAKKLLSEYLQLDFFHNKYYDFRKSVNYSIRTQNDYRDVYKLNKFALGKDVDWKPYMFDLLGFKGEILKQKYEIDAEIEDLNKSISKIKIDLSVTSDERDSIVAEKDIVLSEFKDVEKEIDHFNFYRQDKELIQNGIENLEVEISYLNSESYRLNYEIEKLRRSIKNNFAFDLKKVKKIFEEAEIYFSSQLVEDYENLIQFNKKLTVERNKQLDQVLKQKLEELNEVNNSLLNLNNERESLLGHLTETDSFSRFKYSQKKLVSIQGKLLNYDEKLKAIDDIIRTEKRINKLNDKVSELVNKIKEIHHNTENNNKYSEIRRLFQLFYKNILNESAYLSWRVNKKGNVEFIPPKIKSSINVHDDTAKDEGNTYQKLLCVVFDLAILATYNKESYFRFVYHDDVLSQMDNGIKLRLLKQIENILSEYKLQYILSAIKSDLPVDEKNNLIKFDPEDIILSLNDKKITGTLFGMEF